MRIFPIFFLLTCGSSLCLNAQFIKAGQFQPNHYYFNLQPDSTIQAPNAITPTYAECPLDLNGDGIIDFKLHVANFGGLGSNYRRCYIEPKNNNQIAFVANDSCFSIPQGCLNNLIHVYGMARAFKYGEQIDNSAQWVDSLLYLSYLSESINCFYCSGETFVPWDTNYIGTRIFINSDTSYCWIKVRYVTDKSCTIEAMAGESVIAGAQEGKWSTWPIRVYPNPVSDRLHVDFGGTLPAHSVFQVWENTGRSVFRMEMEASVHSFSTHINFPAGGIYFYTLWVPGKGTSQGSFVVAD